MSNPIIIVVPILPPTVNHMYITLRRGGKALTEQAEIFRKLVAADVLHSGQRTDPDGPLALTMRLTFGDKRRQDLDNRLKAAIDAAALALHFDDCRIVRIVAERVGYAPGQPQCELRLERYDG
jgi:Holliday junction resolvase RusA-like endonuclease